MNFSEFCEANKFERLNAQNTKNSQNNAKNMAKTQQNQQNFEDFYSKEQKDELENKLSKYQNMSESQLTAELFKEVNKQKQSGNFSAQKLDEIKNSIAPMLTAEQQDRLNELVNMLK